MSSGNILEFQNLNLTIKPCQIGRLFGQDQLLLEKLPPSGIKNKLHLRANKSPQ